MKDIIKFVQESNKNKEEIKKLKVEIKALKHADKIGIIFMLGFANVNDTIFNTTISDKEKIKVIKQECKDVAVKINTMDNR